MSKPRPNFFIVGAPKCGTSAMHVYLSEHPRIYMSPRKEPHFFSDLGRERDVATLDEYLDLFKGAEGGDYLAIGEGSTTYLYVPGALEKIKEYDPNAKIVAMVRNPIAMIQSLHSYNLWRLREDVEGFEEAWRLQGERKAGRRVPPRSVNPYHLQYGEIAKLGKQVQHLYKVFPREQVHIGFADDMRKDCRAAYDATLAFLNVPSDGRTEFPPVNEGRAHGKGSWISKRIMAPPPALIKLAKAMGLTKKGLVMKGASKTTTTVEKKQEISPELRAELADHFRDDVALLGDLTGRDLSGWLAAK
ncbi:hypothetical protein BH11ARM2_BH11ARM2_02290 [soil metagenome]